MTASADAETFVRELADELTSVRPGECVFCYVVRMLDAFGCDNTLRWAARFRDLAAPRATALESRLWAMGGFCDCEIFLNGVTVERADGRRRHVDRNSRRPRPRRPSARRGRAGPTGANTLRDGAPRLDARLRQVGSALASVVNGPARPGARAVTRL
jgi:hypothetical protein